jgi:hypothetical protein
METLIFVFQLLAVSVFSLLVFLACTDYSEASKKRWNSARQARWQRELAAEAERRSQREAEYLNHL